MTTSSSESPIMTHMTGLAKAISLRLHHMTNTIRAASTILLPTSTWSLALQSGLRVRARPVCHHSACFKLLNDHHYSPQGHCSTTVSAIICVHYYYISGHTTCLHLARQHGCAPLEPNCHCLHLQSIQFAYVFLSLKLQV